MVDTPDIYKDADCVILKKLRVNRNGEEGRCLRECR
jgi:hypothetical protein